MPNAQQVRTTPEVRVPYELVHRHRELRRTDGDADLDRIGDLQGPRLEFPLRVILELDLRQHAIQSAR